MKKTLLNVLLVGMMVCGLCACGKTEEADNVFVVGFDQEFPPMGFVDANGEFTGFDLELAEEAAKRMGMEIKLQPIAWDAKDMELESGTIDCIWNGFTINGREEEYAWSEPYVDNSQVFVVAADSGIKTFEDLAGKVVLVQADSSALHALQPEVEATDDAETKAAKEAMQAFTATLKELQQVPEYNTAFLNMEAGAADAVAMDIGVARYQIESRGEKFVMLEEAIASEQYGVGFKLGNDALRDTVQNTLNEMVKDGTFAEIAEDWGLTDSVCLGK